MSFTDKLQWRYATKKFDAKKKLSPEQLDYLLTAVQLAPSSMGLQAYKVIVVSDPETRAKLREVSYNQPQITDASHLFIFAAETNVDEAYGKKHIEHIANTRQIAREALAGFEQSVLGTINRLNDEQKVAWGIKQAYIALGVLLSAAADAAIDTCPMEGFQADKVDEILGLREKGLTVAAIAAAGFRAEDDQYSKLTKVRRPQEELFIHV